MTHHRSNSTVVYSVVSFGVEERGLEDGGWEHNFIKRGVVVGVDGLWSHEPLYSVGRGVNFPHATTVLESL